MQSPKGNSKEKLEDIISIPGYENNVLIENKIDENYLSYSGEDFLR